MNLFRKNDSVPNDVLTTPDEHTLMESPPLYVESALLENAAALRSSLEQQAAGDGGITPFLYVFREDCYQFLTASAERIFTPQEFSLMIERLRSWCADKVGARRVSTPQVRLYIKDSFRNLLRDDVGAKWRYSVSLTRDPRMLRCGKQKVAILDSTGPV
jgi:hypothetical protein